MTKTIIETPVFYKENDNAPVLQLLNFNHTTGTFETHDVIKGCSSSEVHLEDVRGNMISLHVDDFMHDTTKTIDGFSYKEALGKSHAWMYLRRLGIKKLVFLATQKKKYSKTISLKEA